MNEEEYTNALCAEIIGLTGFEDTEKLDPIDAMGVLIGTIRKHRSTIAPLLAAELMLIAAGIYKTLNDYKATQDHADHATAVILQSLTGAKLRPLPKAEKMVHNPLTSQEVRVSKPVGIRGQKPPP